MKLNEAGSIRAYGEIIGESSGIKKVCDLIERAAAINIPVMIIGESGTGKELVAREIHERSERKERPFVPVNLGGTTPELVNNELFGHEKGAYTGASTDSRGLFYEAKGGTLFLDEITTMDTHTQITLLRVLEQSVYRSVGGRKEIPTDVRIIAAANVDPFDAVSEGEFRKDLLYRLQVMRINIPPLRKRKRDIKILCLHYLERFNREFGKNITEIHPEVFRLMKKYEWPGNVRELKNVIAQAVVMADEEILGIESLPARMRKEFYRKKVYEKDPDIITPHPSESSETDAASEEPVRSGDYMESSASAAGTDGIFIPYGVSLEEVEKLYILKLINTCGNNKTRAAEILQISRKALYDKLKRWNIV